MAQITPDTARCVDCRKVLADIDRLFGTDTILQWTRREASAQDPQGGCKSGGALFGLLGRSGLWKLVVPFAR